MQQPSRPRALGPHRSRVAPLVLVLAGMLGIALLSPVSAHHKPKHTRKQIRAINTELGEVAGALGDRYTKDEADALFGSDDRLMTFLHRRDMGQPNSLTLLQVGPFSFSSLCEDEGVVHAVVLLDTSEDGGVYRATPSTGGTLSTGGVFLGGVDTAYGTLDTNDTEIGGHAMVPSGWAIDFRVAIATGLAGFDCTFSGWALITNRP